MVVVHGYGTNYQRIDPALTWGWKITSVILGNGRFTDSLQIVIPSWDFANPGHSNVRSECSILDDEQWSLKWKWPLDHLPPRNRKKISGSDFSFQGFISNGWESSPNKWCTVVHNISQLSARTSTQASRWWWWWCLPTGSGSPCTTRSILKRRCWWSPGRISKVMLNMYCIYCTATCIFKHIYNYTLDSCLVSMLRALSRHKKKLCSIVGQDPPILNISKTGGPPGISAVWWLHSTNLGLGTYVSVSFSIHISIWLVVDLALWKIWKSVGIIIPNIWKNNEKQSKCSKPPTR